MTNKFIVGGVIVSLIFSVLSFFRGSAPVENFIGAIAGTLLAENYIPYVNYNDGYYSGNPLQLTGDDGDITIAGNLSVGTTTNTNIINAGTGSSATTTIDMGQVCFRFITPDPSNTVIYYWPVATSTGAGMGLGGWATSTVSCF